MINKLKQMFIVAVALTAFATPLALVGVVHAENELQGSLCNGTNLGLGQTQDDSCTQGDSAGNQVNTAVKLGLNLFSAIVGIIAVVMIIIGGVKYITSNGDSGNITSAKNTILYAVIGLVVVALAQIIVKFVLERFVGQSAV